MRVDSLGIPNCSEWNAQETRRWRDLVYFMNPLHVSCMILGNLSHFSELQFSQLSKTMPGCRAIVRIKWSAVWESVLPSVWNVNYMWVIMCKMLAILLLKSENSWDQMEMYQQGCGNTGGSLRLEDAEDCGSLKVLANPPIILHSKHIRGCPLCSRLWGFAAVGREIQR